ncbi:MAG: ABC transporter ATP-binding protein [Hyphomicrobiaceae bacterium]
MTLNIVQACRSFGGLEAARDVSVNVAPGQVVGLIGPNGAGKTTLINLITGVLRLDSGSVTVDGQDITTRTIVGVAQSGISRTFQNVRLLPESSVLDNVALGLGRFEDNTVIDCLLGLPRSYRTRRQTRTKALEILEDIGMSEYADYPASALAYGHQRRVEIARALAAQPKYILLDEPVAGMNDVEAGELADLVRKIAATGVGVLLIEHNMGFVNALCSHIYVLSTGKIIGEGGPREIASNPVVVEAYLGA